MTHHGVITQTLAGAGIIVGGSALAVVAIWVALWLWEQERVKIAAAWIAIIMIGGLSILGVLYLFYTVGCEVLP